MSDPTGDALRASMIEIPLSQINAIPDFIAAVNKHRDAVEKHMMGNDGVPAPYAHPLIEAVMARVPDAGPVDQRGPDKIVVLPFTVIDDLPKSPEVQQALSVLRETMGTWASG